MLKIEKMIMCGDVEEHVMGGTTVQAFESGNHRYSVLFDFFGVF
jgi:hypothetical protein